MQLIISSIVCFFFKQKTAYDMRISDWSSDVCSSDLSLSHWFRAHPKLGMRDRGEVAEAVFDVLRHLRRYRQYAESGTGPAARRLAILGLASVFEIGRAHV